MSQEKIEPRYYPSRYVMELFHIAPQNYTTFKKVCVKLKLPRIKVGKALLFPRRQFDRRLDMIERKQLANFGIQEVSCTTR